MPSPFRLAWSGDDPDGNPDTRPAGYRFLLMDLEDPSTFTFLVDPDSLFKLGVSTAWEDWSFISGDTTSLNFSNLVPNKSYLAVILAVDQAGATALREPDAQCAAVHGDPPQCRRAAYPHLLAARGLHVPERRIRE
jgi:hypothetical protein